MNTLHITNDRLRVSIAKPGTAYGRSRFDWTGFITQVVLDGKHTFCAYESLVPEQGTGGIGLCNAFDEIGVEEAGPGECFTKPGIGLITRPDEEPFSVFKEYDITPFPVQFDPYGDSIRFISSALDCKGYSFVLQKELSLAENQLKIGYSLQNTGTKAFETEEYVHNFLCLDNTPIGPDYVLKAPYQPQFEVKHGELLCPDKEFVWNKTPEEYFYCSIRGQEAVSPHYWELTNLAHRVGIRETSNFQVSKYNLWGTPHVISPEIFIKIALKPGETKQWQRVYDFFTF